MRIVRRQRRPRLARASLWLLVVASTWLVVPVGQAGSRGVEGLPPVPGLSPPEPADAAVPAKIGNDSSSDPLVPFRLSFGTELSDVLERFPDASRRHLRTSEASYLHLQLSTAGENEDESRAEPPSLTSPEGTSVVDGDLYFDGSGTLIEASLVLSSEIETRHVLHELEAWLGRPDFEVILPGGLDILVGWRAEHGYMIGSFSDIPLFQLSAFRHAPDDLLAGSHLMLYEGLSDYSERLAAGDSPAVLLKELLEIVSWVERSRRVLQPGP